MGEEPVSLPLSARPACCCLSAPDSSIAVLTARLPVPPPAPAAYDNLIDPVPMAVQLFLA
jgi:hypothetical protein